MQAPYASLVSLSRRLSNELQAICWAPEKARERFVSKPPEFSLSGNALKDIFAWCSRHGLLGVFHQSTFQIDDFWEDLFDQSTVHTDDSGEHRKWTWARGRWEKSLPWPGERKHGAWLTTLVVSGVDLKALTAAAGFEKFLVSNPGGFDPPDSRAPGSKRFFSLYGEPLGEWLLALTSMAEAIWQRDLETLNVVAGRAMRVRWLARGRVRSKLAFPSLLSVFAEMYLQDLERGALLRNCARCGEPFVAHRKWTAYCSRSCATKERQRRFLQGHPGYYRREGD